MFSGFTAECFEFMMAIGYNNNREFFYENHDWYTNSVRKPLLELASELNSTIETIDPELERRPERMVSRINRDLRFSKDKSPYRDYMWIGIHKSENKGSAPGFYVDLSANHVGWGMGFWEDNRPLCDAHRRAMRNNPEEIEELVKDTHGRFGFSLRSYKRMTLPEMIPERLRDWYALRSFYAYREIKPDGIALTRQLSKEIESDFALLTPLYRFFDALRSET
ncbi:MAG: DUF2461 domain-containing protein [Clostridiales bacterium]|nr:DUF2461 domain-containing protein [Clostridiales bacterium]